MLDSPEAVGARLDPQAHFVGSVDEVLLDVLRHEATLFRFGIGVLEGREIDVRTCQGDARGFLVVEKPGGIDLVKLVEVLIQPTRIVGGFAEHFRQVHVVEREHLADYVEDAVGKDRPHLLQLLKEAFQNAALDDWLAILGFSGYKIEGVDVPVLPDAVDSAEPLFQARGVPGHVVVDHEATELEVDALAGCLGCDADLASRAELLLGVFPQVWVHAAVDFAGRIAPLLQVRAQVRQRVTMFGEDQELAPAVAEFVELCLGQAVAQSGQLRVVGMVANAATLSGQIVQRGDLGPKLVEFKGVGELVGQVIAGLLIKVVFFLLHVGQPALELREVPAALGGGKLLKFVQQALLLLKAPPQRLGNGHRGTGQAALEDSTDQGDAGLLPAACLGQELVDIGRDRLVEVVFLPVEPEHHCVGMAVREQPAAVQVLDVLLETTESPGAVRAQPEDVCADLTGLVAQAMGLGKEVGVEQPDEVCEPVIVAVVRRGGQQEEMVRLRCQVLGKLESLGLLDFVAAARVSLGVGAALVGLVDDDQVPLLLPDSLAHFIPLGVVHGRYDLGGPLPRVYELLLVHGREDDLELLAEPPLHFVLPLDRQRSRAEDEDPLDGAAELQFLDQQAGHDGLAGTGIVGKKEPQAWLWQHLKVHGFDLVWQRADAR